MFIKIKATFPLYLGTFPYQVEFFRPVMHILFIYCQPYSAISRESRLSFPYDTSNTYKSLQWCHNEHNGISFHRHPDCLLSCLFRHRSKKTSKLHVTGLGEGNPPVTGGFPSQRASNAENVFIWWCHHVLVPCKNWTQTWLSLQLQMFKYLTVIHSSNYKLAHDFSNYQTSNVTPESRFSGLPDYPGYGYRYLGYG